MVREGLYIDDKAPIREYTLLVLFNRHCAAFCLLGFRVVTPCDYPCIPLDKGYVSKLLFATDVSMNLEVYQQSLTMQAYEYATHTLYRSIYLLKNGLPVNRSEKLLIICTSRHWLHVSCLLCSRRMLKPQPENQSWPSRYRPQPELASLVD